MRRRRYREPVFSSGFTAFLLVVMALACGVALYIVMGGNQGAAGIMQSPDYENRTSGLAVYEPGGYDSAAGDDAAPGETPYGEHYDTPYDEVTGGSSDEIPFVLLTQVDNSLLPWYLKLVNRYNFLDYYFLPQLTPIGGGHYFDARAADALLRMLDSARADGLSPLVVSSFRSVSRQTYLFNRQVQRRLDDGYTAEDAFEAARRVVAYPGSSEHNLGLAVDIVSNNYHGLTARQAETPEGIWLAQNSYRYGFVLRYPYYQQHITNIIFEPWHFRYVGIYAATEMFERGLVLEEFVSERLAR